MHNQTFAACIFDFDGVIIDSEPLHAEAKRLMLEHFRIPYPAGLFFEFKGRSDRDFFSYVAAELTYGCATVPELDVYMQQQYLELFDKVQLVPGSLDFLRAARKKYAKIGLATSATFRDLSLAVRKYKIEGWFDIIFTGDDTVRHKPHPEPYLKVMTALQVNAAETLVIEDSPNGIIAAKAAGCTVAAITTTFSAAQVFSAGADCVGDSFIELGQALGLSLTG